MVPSMADQDDFAAFMRGDQTTQLRQLKTGEKVECKVVQIGGDSVFVDVGARADGRIPSTQLLAADGSFRVEVGQTLQATVVDPGASGGPLLAVTFGGGAEVDTAALEIARETGTPVEGKVSAAIKGGLEVDLGGVRAFCPASQAAGAYLADLTSLVGESVTVIVMEVADEGRTVVVSRRKALAAERKQAAVDATRKLETGQILEGAISSIQKFGAFVDLGGIEGLVHISELSNSHVDEVSDIVTVGEAVQVKVLEIEPPQKPDAGPRIRLSMKALQQTEPGEQAQAGEVLAGTVVRMLPHGLVVSTPKGEGMVPMRELGMAPGADHRRAFPVGAELDVTPTSTAAGRVRFSASKVAEVRARQDFDAYRAKRSLDDGAGVGMGSLGALLGSMDRSALPPGPKPKPKPKPAPKAATPQAPKMAERVPSAPAAQPTAKPAPERPPLAPQAATPMPAAEPTTDDDPTPTDAPRRRRIISRRS